MTEFTPSATQAAAIREIKEWFETRTEQQQVFRLFGYAGSGKSTVLKFALDELGLSPHRSAKDGRCVPGVVTATFTGKAALVLTRKGTPARTIHSLIYSVIESTEEEIEEAARKIAVAERDADRSLLVPRQVRAVHPLETHRYLGIGRRHLVQLQPELIAMLTSADKDDVRPARVVIESAVRVTARRVDVRPRVDSHGALDGVTRPRSLVRQTPGLAHMRAHHDVPCQKRPSMRHDRSAIIATHSHGGLDDAYSHDESSSIRPVIGAAFSESGLEYSRG